MRRAMARVVESEAAMIQELTPERVAELRDAVVIDVREYPEFAAGAISKSRLVPLSTLKRAAENWDRNAEYIFVCKVGQRSMTAARQMSAAGFANVANLAGGIDAWRASGLPLDRLETKVWSLERQVRTIAGSLVVITAILGLTVSRWFFAGTIFVGAGLTFAGISNICMMATLLGKMPWNKPRTVAAGKPSEAAPALR
ncbi:MAG: rhodanese-like domain-containing protein [Candidatus Acidiferrales bacterium]